jgi:hypothetical protein
MTVSPATTELAAFWMVRQGADWVPALLSLPVGEI